MTRARLRFCCRYRSGQDLTYPYEQHAGRRRPKADTPQPRARQDGSLAVSCRAVGRAGHSEPHVRPARQPADHGAAVGGDHRDRGRSDAADDLRRDRPIRGLRARALGDCRGPDEYGRLRPARRRGCGNSRGGAGRPGQRSCDHEGQGRRVHRDAGNDGHRARAGARY